MKILSAIQTREADAYTIANEPISSLDLMERAATRMFEAIIGDLDPGKAVLVVCGTGNNGGDGLVLARLLSQHGYDVSVYTIPLGKESADYISNKERLPFPQLSEINAEVISTADVIIDAIFGSGLNRPLEGIVSELIETLNSTEALRIALDIPSGLFADSPSSGIVFRADVTFTFQMPKLAFMLPENGHYVGNWQSIDIGLDKNFLAKAPSDFIYVTHEFASQLLPVRAKFSHKGDFGRILLLTGSKGKMGAATLASGACLRAGAGLLTVYVPGVGLDIIQMAVPEAMAIADDNTKELSNIPEIAKYDVIGAGPGIGTAAATAECIAKLLKAANIPLVLDADALNILSSTPALLSELPQYSILTPHPGEFRRLAGDWNSDFERLEMQRNFSKKHGVVLVLKGAHTSISTPDGLVYFNSSGNPGMATAGSGDVLTGVITGLLGQGLSSVDAAVLGVYLHGLAGDLAAEAKTESAMIAGDIIREIPNAFRLF